MPPIRDSVSSASTRHALIGGMAAALTAATGLLLLRSTLQVRSVPERLVEWLLLFVPPALFERFLQAFGFDAKRYALYLSIAVMLGALAWLGYEALRRRWSVRAIAMLGMGLWLGVMLIIMPLTSAGIFAADLVEGKRAAIGGYLAVGLSYAAVLALVRTRTISPGSISASRRTALAIAGGTLASYIGTYLAVWLLPHKFLVPTVVLEDPQEPVPSGGLDAPNPHPNNVQPGATAAPAVAPTTTPDGFADVAPERELTRDKDGAVVPSGRTPGQLAAPITSNDDFYVVTKNAAGDPLLGDSDWRLLVDGEVAQSFKLDYATVRKLPSVEITKTLECISNFVGRPELAPFGAELISTATWRGIAVRDVLGLVGGPSSSATWAVFLAADEYTSAFPLQVAMDPGTLLAYEMNGQPLPREHGFPLRLLVPDRYGMKDTKWIVGMRLMSRESIDWYGQRNWSKTAVVQTMCRIDSPAPGAALAAGTRTVAGIAYAGSRGIKRVEFTVDDGASWQVATLSQATTGEDRWVGWRGEFDLIPGRDTTITARAVDGTGALQAEAFSLPEPEGGSGWPRIVVTPS